MSHSIWFIIIIFWCLGNFLFWRRSFLIFLCAISLFIVQLINPEKFIEHFPKNFIKQSVNYLYSTAVYIFSASLGEPDIRKTFKSLSSMADIRTFFSLAWQKSIVYEYEIQIFLGMWWNSYLFTNHVGEKFCVENNFEATHCSHN